MAGSAVEAEGIVKRFGETVAIGGVDLTVEEGSVFGLLGPNGAGKTTMVRVLATLLRPDSGSASVFGRDVVGEASRVREQIALTGQFAAVDELLTGRENLRMFGQLFRLDRREAGRRADELLERFDLADAGDRLARTYSGGMRRRLDLASSLLTRPRILFLDEPTTGLDPRSRNQIWDITRELVRGGTTLLLTTQYLEEADQLTDRIAVIDHGRVIAEGTGDELKDSVGGQMIFVRLANSWDRERAIEALRRLGCGTPEPSELERELTLPAPEDGIAMIERSAHALREASIAVSDLGLRRPTLDDVFLTLTGAPATADGTGPETGAAHPPTPSPPPPPAPPPQPTAPGPRPASFRQQSRRRRRSRADGRAARLDHARRLRGVRAQYAPLPAPAPDAPVLDHPADHVRAAVLLRLRRRDRRLAPGGRQLQGLPPPRDLRPVDGIPGDPDGDRAVGGHEARGDRQVPVDAHGAIRGPR